MSYLRIYSIWFGLILTALNTSPVRAADELRTQLSEVAKEVKKFLAGRNEDSIAVGSFTGPAQIPSSAGPGIVKILAEELEKQEIQVKLRANLGVTGTYRDVAEKDGSVTVLLKARIEDRSGLVLVELERKISDQKTVSSLLGATSFLMNRSFYENEGPPRQDRTGASDRPERNKKGKIPVDSVRKPQVGIIGTHISADKVFCPYAFEVLVKSGEEYRSRKPVEKEGLAFVRIERAEVYAVRLINNSDSEAAATLTIDGLSIFAFSENSYNYVLVPSKSSTE